MPQQPQKKLFLTGTGAIFERAVGKMCRNSGPVGILRKASKEKKPGQSAILCHLWQSIVAFLCVANILPLLSSNFSAPARRSSRGMQYPLPLLLACWIEITLSRTVKIPNTPEVTVQRAGRSISSKTGANFRVSPAQQPNLVLFGLQTIPRFKFTCLGSPTCGIQYKFHSLATTSACNKRSLCT